MVNKYKTLDKMVYNLLLEKIKKGDLVCNEHLAEEKLAAEFGVSRSPLRKAIATLTAQG
ncbi:GntR family transcriptional regulator, partial [Listeria welshimeri]|nr:GntR family transcriptional regulator [Listeria welshimeri]